MGQPRFDVLLEIFLQLEVGGDNDNRAARKKLVEEGGKKRLGGRANAGIGQRAARFQTPGEGAHGGNLREVSEQRACRFY